MLSVKKINRKRRLPGRTKKTLRNFYLRLCEDKRDDFLWEIGTTHNYLQQIYCGHKAASKELALRIEAASGGAVPADQVRLVRALPIPQ
jgi:hypothetical protein